MNINVGSRGERSSISCENENISNQICYCAATRVAILVCKYNSLYYILKQKNCQSQYKTVNRDDKQSLRGMMLV